MDDVGVERMNVQTMGKGIQDFKITAALCGHQRVNNYASPDRWVLLRRSGHWSIEPDPSDWNPPSLDKFHDGGKESKLCLFSKMSTMPNITAADVWCKKARYYSDVLLI